ncbi:MAG: hypothetical protein ACRENL_00145 [Candidatus Dormibacteria bacterium]
MLDRWIATTSAGIDEVGPTSPAGQRLAERLAFFEFLREEMTAVLVRWHEKRANHERHNSA